MNRHMLVEIGWKRLKQANIYTAMVLPPAVAGIVVLLLVYYGLEWKGGQALPTGWADYIPKSTTKGLFMAFMTAGTAFTAYQKARKHPTIANGSTVAGIAITVALSWLTQQCSLTGAVVSGLTAAGTIIIVATAVRFLTGRTNWDTTIPQPVEAPGAGAERLISVMRIGMAIFMGFVVLIALSYEELSSPARPLLRWTPSVGQD